MATIILGGRTYLSPFPYNAIAYDGASTIAGGTFYNCNPSWFTGSGATLPSKYSCVQSSIPQTFTLSGGGPGPPSTGTGSTGTPTSGTGGTYCVRSGGYCLLSPLITSPTQTFVITPVTIGADSNDGQGSLLSQFTTCMNGQFNFNAPSYGQGCGHTSIYYTGTLTGGVQYAFNKVDQNFANLYGITLPNCNPCNIGKNNTATFWITEYGGDIRLIRQDTLTPAQQCFNVGGIIGATINNCTGGETMSTNQVLNGFLNPNNNIAATILIDLTVPNTLPLTSSDQVGIIAVFTAQGSPQAPGACIIGAASKTSIVNIAQCSPTLSIPIVNYGFTPFSYSTLGNFNPGQFPPSIVNSLQTTVQFKIQVANIQPQYSASCGANNCHGNDPPVISGDSSIVVDIPFTFYYFDATPIVCPAPQTLVNGICVTPNPCPGGTYVNGVCTQNCTNGATNPPTCNNQPCTNGATNPPACNNAVTCTNSATNPPACNNNTSCTNGATNPPVCNNTGSCPFGGTYPSCNPCPGGQVLQNGICVTLGSCPAGYQVQAGQCISTLNNGQCGFGGQYNVSGIGCPKLTNPNGNIIVHVTSATFNLPLAGVQVAINPSSLQACSPSQQNVFTTDANGNALFVNLPTTNGANYLACSVGTGGTVTLIFIGLGITYTAATTSCTTYAGGTTTCNLPLQTNADVYFTAFTVGLILLFILIIVVLIVAGRGRAARQVATYGPQAASKTVTRYVTKPYPSKARKPRKR